MVKIVRMFFGSENGENDGQLGMVRVFLAENGDNDENGESDGNLGWVGLRSR